MSQIDRNICSTQTFLYFVFLTSWKYCFTFLMILCHCLDLPNGNSKDATFNFKKAAQVQEPCLWQLKIERAEKLATDLKVCKRTEFHGVNVTDEKDCAIHKTKVNSVELFLPCDWRTELWHYLHFILRTLYHPTLSPGCTPYLDNPLMVPMHKSLKLKTNFYSLISLYKDLDITNICSVPIGILWVGALWIKLNWPWEILIQYILVTRSHSQRFLHSIRCNKKN